MIFLKIKFKISFSNQQSRTLLTDFVYKFKNLFVLTYIMSFFSIYIFYIAAFV